MNDKRPMSSEWPWIFVMLPLGVVAVAAAGINAIVRLFVRRPPEVPMHCQSNEQLDELFARGGKA